LLQSARDQAAVVAKALTGQARPYDPVPYFYSRFLDFAWKFYGIFNKVRGPVRCGAVRRRGCGEVVRGIGGFFSFGGVSGGVML
jgi:hypothetical protein